MDDSIKKMLIGSVITIFTIVSAWLIISAIRQYQIQQSIQIITDSANRTFQKIAEDGERQRIQNQIARKQEEENRKQAEINRRLQQEHEAWQKAKALKEQSPQCKFWRLQKRDGTADNADEKINQYCNP